MVANKIPYHGFLLLSFLFFALPYHVLSQSNKSDLENKKDRLEKSIEYADFLIDQTQEQKESTLNELILLQSKIDKRQQLIESYQQEHNFIVDTIFEKLLYINDLNDELQALRNEYAMMVVSAFENQNYYQRLLYVMAAADLNQAYRRMNYFRGYAGKRNQQITLIRDSEKKYFSELELLNIKLTENQSVLNDLSLEYAQLEEELSVRADIVGDLNNKLDQLLAEQEQNRANALELESRINEMLAEENLESRNDDGAADAADTRTPEEIILSSGFTENQGKLPWPLEKGIISSNFGEHSHPEIQSIMIKNNGIDILTHQGANARSVFEGVVTRVMSVPNYNNVVIVRHGDFLTVYSNLSAVFVEPGSKVETKQEIGTIYTDQAHTKTKLHFEIWQGKHLLDPIEWITSYDDSDAKQQHNP